MASALELMRAIASGMVAPAKPRTQMPAGEPGKTRPLPETGPDGYLKSHRYSGPINAADTELRRLKQMGAPESPYPRKQRNAGIVTGTTTDKTGAVKEDPPYLKVRRPEPSGYNPKGESLEMGPNEAPSGETDEAMLERFIQQLAGQSGEGRGQKGWSVPSGDGAPQNPADLFKYIANEYDFVPNPGADYGYEDHADFDAIANAVRNDAAKYGWSEQEVEDGIAAALDEMGWND